jgi:hypothetical protein
MSPPSVDCVLELWEAFLLMKIEVSGHKFNFPHKCACCGATPDTSLPASATRSTGKKVVHTDSKSWDFPYCSRCVKHVQASKSAAVVLSIVVLASVILAVIVGSKSTGSFGLLAVIAGLILAVATYTKLILRAKSICVPSCSTVNVGVKYHGWQGTRHVFEVSSANYSTDFMVANQTKLVNVPPEVWQRLKTNGYVAGPNQPQSARRNIT